MPEPRLTVDRGVGEITLADPGGVNSLDPGYVARLCALVREAHRAADVAVILLRAEARTFSVGGDIDWFAAAGERLHDEIVGLIDDVTEMIGTLHEGPKVSIAAVHGAVAGGGLGIALACDLVVAADDTTFAIAYGKIGASPDLGVSAFLARDLGYRRALELCLMCDRLTAADARSLGLVNRVVAPDQLDDAARELAVRIAAGPRGANATAKRLLRSAARTDLAGQLADELRSVAGLSRTGDWAEGIRAFLEGRDPVFGEPAPDLAATPPAAG